MCLQQPRWGEPSGVSESSDRTLYLARRQRRYQRGKIVALVGARGERNVANKTVSRVCRERARERTSETT